MKQKNIFVLISQTTMVYLNSTTLKRKIKLNFKYEITYIKRKVP